MEGEQEIANLTIILTCLLFSSKFPISIGSHSLSIIISSRYYGLSWYRHSHLPYTSIPLYYNRSLLYTYSSLPIYLDTQLGLVTWGLAPGSIKHSNSLLLSDQIYSLIKEPSEPPPHQASSNTAGTRISTSPIEA